MKVHSKFVIFLFCCLAFAFAGCSSSPSAGGQTPTSSSSSATGGQPTAALAPTQAPPTETQSPTSAPTATEAPPTSTAASSNPLDMLTNLLNSFGTVKAYRVQITQTGGTPTAEASGMTMEVVPPDRVHTLIPGAYEVIQIGSTYYYRLGPNGTWTKKTLATGGTPSPLTGAALDPKFLVTSAAKANGVSFSGPDVLDGKPMLTYSYTSTAGPGTPESNITSGKMWVGATDALPYKLEVDNKDGSVTTLVYTYSSDIQINPPIP